MALTEQVVLDIQSAQRQIDDLERQLAGLGTPITVPVDVDARDAVQELEREIGAADPELDVEIDDEAFRRVAAALGISEDRARELSGELRQSIGQSTKLETDLRAVAQSMGLSGREASDFVRQMRRAEDAAEDTADATTRIGTRGVSAFSNLRGSIVGLVSALGAIQGARVFLDFARQSIDAASDLEESTSKAQVVFGEFFDDIQAFASTAPQALGLANQQALEFTGTFGNLFTALGLSQSAAADLAPQIVQLGSDLASFNNLEVTEALDKLRAGLVGEAEPLRALGINLNAAAVEAKALELGLGGTTGEIDDAAKVQARYALILEQTTTAQGDFARTSDGIANQQRTLAASFQGTQEAVGQALLPAFQQLLDSGQDLIPMLEQLAPVIGFLGEVAIDTVAAFAPIGDILGALAQPIADIADAINAAGGADPRGLDRLSESARDLFENLDDTLPLFKEFGTFLETGFDAATLREEFEKLAGALEDGVDPLPAATAALERFNREGTLTEGILRGVAETARLTSSEAAALRIALREGDLGFLTADELANATAVLGEFIDVGGRFEGRITGMGRAARDARDDLEGLAEPIRGSSAEIGRFNDVLAGLDFAADVDRIRGEFDRLPDGLSAARAAMQTEEEEITEDWAGFLTDLTDELARVEAFRTDVEVLRALGLDRLADAIEQEGLSAADVASGAVDNIAQAIEANDALEEAADTEAAAFRQRLADAISQGTLDLTIPVNVIAAIQALVLEGLGGQAAAEIVGAGGAGPNVGSGVTVNQNFEGFTPSTPDLTRAAQAVNQVTQR